jgi:hypothetical protein
MNLNPQLHKAESPRRGGPLFFSKLACAAGLSTTVLALRKPQMTS